MVTRELLTSSQRAYYYEIPEYMDQREILRYYTIWGTAEIYTLS
ncbi:hypothetical protein [Bacillus mycoides]